MAVRPNSSNPPQASSSPSTDGLALVPQGAHQGKPALPLTRAFTLIGSRSRAHLHLVSPSVSKSHTAVIVTRASVYVRDLASRAHTIVNGRPQKEADLKHGDKLAVGNFSFRLEAKAFSTSSSAPPAPKAVLVVQGAEFPMRFDGRSILIGRRPTCDVPLLEESVSTVHCLIFEADGKHYVRDLGSRTGTLLNGNPVHQQVLSFGDELRIGETQMRYVSETAEGESRFDEEDLAGTARLSEASEDLAPTAFVPPAVPAPTRRVETPASARPAPEPLPVAPAAEEPEPQADDLDLIPLAGEEEAAPVGNWGRVRPAGPPAAEAAEPIPLEEPAAELEPVAEAAPEVEPEPVADEPAAPPVVEQEPIALEPAGQSVDTAAELDWQIEELEPAEAEAPTTDLGLDVDETPARAPEPLVGDAEPVDLDAIDFDLLPVEEPAAEAAPAAERAEQAPAAEKSQPAAEEAAGVESLDELPLAEAEVQTPAGETAEAVDDLGLDFAEPADADPVRSATRALAPEEFGELDLSGLTLEPVASAGAAGDSGLDIGAPPAPAEDDAAAELAPPADFDLEPALPAAELPPAPAALAPFAEAEAELAEKARKKPAAKKEAAAKREKPSWWSRKKKQQPPATTAVAAETGVEPQAPATVAPAAAAAASAAAPDAPETITGDDLAFLDDILGPAGGAPVSAGADAESAHADDDFCFAPTGEPLADVTEPTAPAEEAIDLAALGDDEAAPDAAGAEAAIDFGAPEAGAVDSLAGLDLSHLATGSGLDLGGVVDAVELPESAEEISPSTDALLPAAAAAGDDFGWEEGAGTNGSVEVLDVTEPTPESALELAIPDLGEPIAEAGGVEAAPALAEPVDLGLSDTTFSRAVEAMGDPALAPVEPTEGELAPEAVEAVTERDAPAERIFDDATEVVTSPTSPADAALDLAFDDALHEALGAADTGADHPSLQFDLGDAGKSAAAPRAATTYGGTPADEAAGFSFEALSEEESGFAASAPAEEGDDGASDLSLPVAAEEDPLGGLAPFAAADEDVSADLSADTLEVGEPEPSAEADAASLDADADEEQAAAPLISDLTSATEDEEFAAPANPAAMTDEEAAEAIDFDLDGAAEGAAASSAAPISGGDEAVDFGALSPEARAEPVGNIDATALETVDDTDAAVAAAFNGEAAAPGEAAPAAEAPAADIAPAAPAAEASPAVDAPQITPYDPFMGMGSDTGSFIGGLPLALPPVAKPQRGAFGGRANPFASRAVAPAAPQAPPQPAAPVPPPPPAAPVAAQDEAGAMDDEAALAALGEPGDEAAADELALPADDELPPGLAPDVEADVEPIDFTTEPAEPAPPVEPPPPPAPPAAPPAAALAKARPVPRPPPPAKNIPPRHAAPPKRVMAPNPFDLGLGDAADGAVEIPPFDRNAPGARPRAGALTTAFDGLVMGPARQNDVFATLGGSAAAADPIFGLPSKPAGTPVAGAPDAEDGATAHDEDDDHDDPAGGVAAAAAPRRGGAAAPAKPAKPAGRRPLGYTPPDAGAAAAAAPTAPPPAKKRRWGVRFLLPMMFVCAGLAVAAVYALQPRFFPRTVEVAGYLEFRGLENLTENERRAELTRQRGLLSGLKPRAVEALLGIDDRLPPAFLAPDANDRDQLAYATILDSAKVQDRSDKLALFHRGTDVNGDPKRMRALLVALYTVNAGMTDDLLGKQQKLDALRARVDQLLREISDLKPRVEQGKKQDEQFVAGLDSRVNELKANDDHLVNELQKARLLVKDMEAELERAVAANGTPAAGGAAVPANAGAAPKDAADDAQLKEMAQTLADVTAGLNKARGAKTARAAAAARQLNDAMSQFDKLIAAAQSEMKGDDQLARYVTAGQNMQRTFRNLYERMALRQRERMDVLNNRKQRLAEKLEAQIKAAWAGDEPLKSLQETLSVKEHHRNAAAATPGLAGQVTKLDAEIASLNTQIDVRRDLVGADRASTGDVREDQAFVDQLLKMADAERADYDKAMAEGFETFQKEAPAIEKLPEEQRRLAGAMAQRSAELNAAREQYLKASAGESADDTQSLETKLAQTQARIDARKRQLADAAAQDLTKQQKDERQFRLAQGRTNLENAKAALEKADAAWRANFNARIEAEHAASRARDGLVRFKNDAAQLARLDAERARKVAEFESLRREVAGQIRPMPPREESVAATAGEDPRLLYSMFAIVGVVGFFSLLMFATAHHHPAPLRDEEQLPFAAAAYADEFAEPAPRFDESGERLNGEDHDLDAHPDDSARGNGRRVAV
jgi:pSer/pThr/pTyr-binding forkhead associated (FHA) protein